MKMANTSTNTAITNNSFQTMVAKTNSEGTTAKSDFTKLLAKKENKANVKGSSIEDCIKELTSLLSNLQANMPKEKNPIIAGDSVDTKEQVVLKDSPEKAVQGDKTADLIALLSSLLNQLNVKAENKDITIKPVMQIQTPTVEGTDNGSTTIEKVKETKNVIQELLASAKTEGSNSILKDQEVNKLEVVLKGLAQVIDNTDKQVSLKRPSESVQTFIKPQLWVTSAVNTDSGNQSNDTQNAKVNTEADKVLQRIAKNGISDKKQSFSNLVTRVSNPNDTVVAKTADNLVINKENLANDVIKTVKFMNVNDIKDLTVKITPKDFGEVVVKLTQEGNATKATITTSNKEVYQLINSNLQEIKLKSSSNTSIKSFSVQVLKTDTNYSDQVTKESTGNINPFIKDIKDNKVNAEQKLTDVKPTGTEKILKSDVITKLETVFNNLTELVDKKANNTQSSKTNANEDKVLEKIAGKDSSDRTQSFANLVARTSSQNDIVTTNAADKLVINKDTLTNDVIKSVKFMNTNDIKDLIVKISPKDLGEVVIKLTQEGNAMKATITTSNKEAFQLINSNLQDINDKISSNNTSIQSFSVDVFNGEGSLFKQGSQQNNGSNKGKNSGSDNIEDQDENGIEGISNDNSNLNILV